MTTQKFTLPDHFAKWIEENLKGVKVKKVSFFGVDKLPINWIPGFSKSFVGMAFINRVFIKQRFLPLDLEDSRTTRLVIHELVHIQQVKRFGVFGFIFKYLWNLRKGYFNHPLEIEAYSEEKRLYKKYVQDMKAQGIAA